MVAMSQCKWMYFRLYIIVYKCLCCSVVFTVIRDKWRERVQIEHLIQYEGVRTY